MKVFWSWQNDYQPKTNRYFIKAALENAISQVGQELGLDDAERPEIDHDTKGEAGAADIAASIFKKISEAAVFVADVTPIATTEATDTKVAKALPNPNVMIELGWALSETGYERVITVLNTAAGHKIDDLPFDIRNRRVLPYELPIDANKATREKASKVLTAAIYAALLTNLREVKNEADLNAAIPRVKAAQEDRSIWASGVKPIEFRSGVGPSEIIEIPHVPRAYLRLSPASWANGIPSVTAQEAIPDVRKPSPAAEGSTAGSFGACEDGYIRIWYSSRGTGANDEAANAVMWFDETGEYWAVHGTAVTDFKGKKSLNLGSIFSRWRSQLTSMTWFLDQQGASALRRVEFGIVSIKGALLPSDFILTSPASRKAEVVLDKSLRDWTEQHIDELLLEMLNRINDACALPRTDIASLHGILRAWPRTG